MLPTTRTRAPSHRLTAHSDPSRGLSSGETLELGVASSVSLAGAVFRMQPTARPATASLHIAINALGEYAGDFLGGEPNVRAAIQPGGTPCWQPRPPLLRSRVWPHR